MATSSHSPAPLENVPEDAFDLRGLPRISQIQQLSGELSRSEPGSTITGVVGDPTAVLGALERDAEALLGGVEHTQIGTTGVMLELSRA